MRRVIIAAAVFVVAGVIALALAQSSQDTSHPISCDSEVADFGAADAGTELHHTFSLTNNSGVDRDVRGVKTDCGCTVAEDIKRIPAQATVVVPVKVALPSEPQVGFAVRVIIDFVDAPPLVLTIKGRVVAELPTTVQFGQFRADQPPTRTFEFLGSAKGTAVLSANVDERWLELRHNIGREGRQDAVLSVSPRRDLPRGPFTTRVTLATNDVRRKSRSVQVEGYVLASDGIARCDRWNI